jgi:hypothetical protein
MTMSSGIGMGVSWKCVVEPGTSFTLTQTDTLSPDGNTYDRSQACEPAAPGPVAPSGRPKRLSDVHRAERRTRQEVRSTAQC